MSISTEANPVRPNQTLVIAGNRLIVYTLAFVLVQLLGLAVVLLLTTTQWFTRHNGYPGMQMTGYSLRLANANCDVVLYGDSSALTGLDPAIVQKITGLKTCNIAEGTTIQNIVGMFPLDEYLKHNRRPAFLLATYTPSIFDPLQGTFQKYQVDGIAYALEYDRTSTLLRGLLHHKRWLLNYTLWAGKSILDDTFNRLLHRGSTFVDTREQRRLRDGIWPFPRPPETHCVRTAAHYKPEQFGRYEESVASFRQRYAVDGTRVILDISPVPDCDVLYDRYAQLSQGLHDNSFERLPISFFNEGDVHFSAAGSEYISRKAGEQILALMHGQSPPPPPLVTSGAGPR